jgi:hypothetical protein
MSVARLRPAYQVAEEAFDIAWAFLRTGISDPLPVQSFIAEIIEREIASGDRNRIRVANKAIRAYEATR